MGVFLDFLKGNSGGLIGGAFNLLGNITDSITQGILARKQRQHDKDMAGLNQQYALEQMEQANEYQVEQWNRENEYNDPSAVRARYEAAGISPHAAFGQGSASGAGIAGGLSGAPSGSGTGHSSNTMFDTDFASLGTDIVAGSRVESQNRRDEAAAIQALEDAKRTALANEHAELEKALGVWAANAQKQLNENEMSNLRLEYQKYKNAQEQVITQYAELNAETDYQKRKAITQKAMKEVEIAEQTLDNMKKQGLLTEQEYQTEIARTSVEWERVKTQSAITAKEEQLVKLAKADTELREEQTRKVLHDIIQGYISAGADLISCITDIVGMLTPIMGLGKAKRVAERVVTEQYDSKGKLRGKKVQTSDKIDGFTNVSN